jgi:hydroxylaminobenzene mutase
MQQHEQVTSTTPADTAETSAKKGLIWHGLVLFFIGLLSGFVIPSLKSPRIGVSAHVEAVLNGMFLILVGGIVWDRIRLSRRIAGATYWSLLYAAYGSWLFCQLAAVFGGSKMLPIAGAGNHALPWQEQLLTIGFGTVGVSFAFACGVVLYGFRKGLR